MFNPGPPPNLKRLADEHMQHDLRDSDRETLKKATAALPFYGGIGALLGASLGVFLAYRIRANRQAIFSAFKAHEQPVAIKFHGGREELLPDLTPVIKPSTAGDVATFGLLGVGTMFFGGQLGGLIGATRAKGMICADPEAKERIETAFKKFQADALRQQADELEKQEYVLSP